jgi:Rrf2 family protein
MQIELSKRGDYAVRAVLDLALHEGGGRRKSREIAAATAVPPKFLPQILAALVQAGIVVATAGRHGGYRLSRPASEISLLDVIVAVEPPSETRGCLLWGRACSATNHCVVHEAWSAAQEALNRQLAVTRFGDLLGRHPTT